MATSTPLLWVSCFLLHLASTLVNAYSTDYTTQTISKYIPKTPKKPFLTTIDSCWRAQSNWASNRQALADCAIGFGKDAIGGKYGKLYIVTDNSDDPANPKPGTLRYGAIQTEPLWIIFDKDMVIRFENELIVNSYKTH